MRAKRKLAYWSFYLFSYYVKQIIHLTTEWLKAHTSTLVEHELSVIVHTHVLI